MGQILNLSEHANDDDVQYLTTMLLYYLVERCGGQVQFSADDAHQINASLATKMIQMQIGKDVMLKIINRVPELQ
jgi:hypothetical protein